MSPEINSGCFIFVVHIELDYEERWVGTVNIYKQNTVKYVKLDNIRKYMVYIQLYIDGNDMVNGRCNCLINTSLLEKKNS